MKILQIVLLNIHFSMGKNVLIVLEVYLFLKYQLKDVLLVLKIIMLIIIRRCVYLINIIVIGMQYRIIILEVCLFLNLLTLHQLHVQLKLHFLMEKNVYHVQLHNIGMLLTVNVKVALMVKYLTWTLNNAHKFFKTI